MGVSVYGKVVIASFGDNENEVFERLVETLSDYTQVEHISTPVPILIFEGGLKIFPHQHKVMCDDIELQLTKHEYGILYFLAQQPGRVFSKEQIYEAVWNESSESCFSAVTNTISRLRTKVRGAAHQKECIQTVQGYGYKFSLKNSQEK